MNTTGDDQTHGEDNTKAGRASIAFRLSRSLNPRFR